MAITLICPVCDGVRHRTGCLKQAQVPLFQTLATCPNGVPLDVDRGVAD